MFTKYIENFLTRGECKSIINMGNSMELIQMKSSRFVNGKLIGENLEYGGNKRTGCYFTDELLEDSTIKTISKKIIDLSNELNPFNNVVYKGVPKYSFNKYGIGDFLDWHSDNHEILNGATITYIIQLNDDYKGGEVKYRINDVEHTLHKKKGSVFIFNSIMEHSVDEVTNGERYSLNVWPEKTIKKSLI